MKKPRSSDEGTFRYREGSEPPRSMNNGFWDREPGERAARMDAACERGGVSNFFDLPPEERASAYDRD